MNKTVMMAGALAALTGIGLPAHAKDADKQFDGFYVGAELGAQHERGIEKDAGYNGHSTNLYYGGILGYRHQMDNGLVLGLEGSFGDSRYKNDEILASIPENDPPFAISKADYTLGLSGTVGVVVGDEGNGLLYMAAGWVKAKNGSKTDLESFAPINFKDDNGWRLGAGYEHALGGGLSVRLSADYVHFGATDASPIVGQANGTSQLNGKAAVIFSF